MSLFDTVWHGWLNRPYKLAKVTDKGIGTPMVLLHGLGRTAHVWQHVAPLLIQNNLRVVAFDLLGFGASPKPDVAYNIDDHARAVIASLIRLNSQQPVIIVGHSMGCLVAVRVARLRPDLVRHLVLYEMPLYQGLPEQRRYRVRTDLYLRFYNKVADFQPTFNPETARLAERLANKIAGVEVTSQTWTPFIRSLRNTIMNQTAADDIKQLVMPMDVIYGTYDMFVIRGKTLQVFGKDSNLVTAHTVRDRHRISPKASLFIVDRCLSALTIAKPL